MNHQVATEENFRGMYCSRCQAKQGQHCVSKTGKRAGESHAARRRALYLEYPIYRPVWWMP